MTTDSKDFCWGILRTRTFSTYLLLGLVISTTGFGILLASLFLEPREVRPSELQIIYDTAARHYQTGRAAELAKLYRLYDAKLFNNPKWIRSRIQESVDKSIKEEVWRERTKIDTIGKWFIWSGILITARLLRNW